MNWRKALCALSIAFFGSVCIAQDITDVEAKPYGSYTGGAIDTVDLATGNLMLNIPLISYPQLGTLPPLSFSVELNNAPYTQGAMACDPDYLCESVSSRYDTSPPGAVYQYNPNTIQSQSAELTYPCPDGNGTCTMTENWGYEDASIPSMGAYLTSSFVGGIVTGQVNTMPYSDTYIGEDDFSLVDPSGTTHALLSDTSSWNRYRAPDGSGYTFIPTPSGTLNAYDPLSYPNGLGWLDINQPQIWLENASVSSGTTDGGVRLGTIYSPTGIKYTNTVQTFPQVNPNNIHDISAGIPSYTPQALISTESDPSNNTITRGPWYWSGYDSLGPGASPGSSSAFSDINTFYTNNSPAFLPGYHGPYYRDSVGRIIPDVISMQTTQYQIPLSNSGYRTLSWTVPGPENNPINYQINYALIANTVTWSPPSNLSSEDSSGDSSVPLPDPSTDVEVNGLAIASIVLPNNTRWTFTYASATGGNYSAGDLEEVTTPSGGTITYTYTSIPAQSPLGAGRCNAVCHAVASRTETDGQGNQWTTNYSYTTPVPTGLPSTSCPTVAGNVFDFTTKETDPLGNDTVHTFCATGIVSGVPVANQYREIETQYYQGSASGNKLLRTVQTAYGSYQHNIIPVVGSYAGANGIINTLPTTITTTTPAATTTDVRQYSQLFTAARIYCIGSNCSNAQQLTIPISYLSPITEITEDGNLNPVRTSSTTFMFQNSSSIYTGAYMDAIPVSETVSGSSGGTGTVSGTTSFGYDENGSPQGPYGNVTSKSETYYLSGSSSGGTSTTTHSVYNSHGMPTATIDGIGNTTAITYDSTGLFPNKVQRPTTNGVPHIDYYSYDSNTGNLNSHTDENNQATGYSYDGMGRVISIQYPDGGGSTICYTDGGGVSCPETSSPVSFSLYTSTTTGPAPAPPITTGHSYDGWGRQYRSTVLSDSSGPTFVDTTYDWEGKVTSVSNPYRGATTYSINPPCGNSYTCYTYDAFGRKTIQTQPDGNTQQWCYDGIVTPVQTKCWSIAESSGGFTPASWTDVSDETGRHTQQVFDALGHMDAVVEPDPVSGNLSMETDYTYDVFGDLFTVNQLGGSDSTQVKRMFYYDMPSRVSRACNPEALGPGQNCNTSSTGSQYSYNANSNLTSKMDNRGITTTYLYDALNRLLSKSYSSDPSGTASSCYLYDGGASTTLSSTTTNGSGRLAAQWTQKGACLSSSPVQTKTSISAYDPMGRLTNEQRCMSVTNCASGSYSMNYTYDLAGKLLTYPSGYGGLAFTNSYETAGRLASVLQGTNSLLFSVPSYTPAGALSAVQLGSALSMSRTYDSRQRVLSETDSAPTQ